MPAGQPRPYLVNLWPNFAKSPQHAQNHALGALLVATNLLNWLSYEKNTICPIGRQLFLKT